MRDLALSFLMCSRNAFLWQKYVRNISASNVVVNRANGWGDVLTAQRGIPWKKR